MNNYNFNENNEMFIDLCTDNQQSKHEKKTVVVMTANQFTNFMNLSGKIDLTQKRSEHIQQIEIPCKFGSKCNRPNCTYLHKNISTTIAQTAPIAQTVQTAPIAQTAQTAQTDPIARINAIPCKFGSNCNKSDCTFLHKSVATPASAPASVPAPVPVPIPTTSSGFHVENPCKFGSKCNKPDCTFLHKSVSEFVPKQIVPKQIVSKQDVPKQIVPKQVVSKQIISKQIVSKQDVLKHDEPQQVITLCKFGSKCNNKANCKFIHICSFGSKCRSLTGLGDCNFVHLS